MIIDPACCNAAPIIFFYLFFSFSFFLLKFSKSFSTGLHCIRLLTEQFYNVTINVTAKTCNGISY